MGEKALNDRVRTVSGGPDANGGLSSNLDGKGFSVTIDDFIRKWMAHEILLYNDDKISVDKIEEKCKISFIKSKQCNEKVSNASEKVSNASEKVSNANEKVTGLGAGKYKFIE